MDEYRLYMLHIYRSFYEYISCLQKLVLFTTQKLNYTLPDFFKLLNVFFCFSIYLQGPIADNF